LLLSRFSSLFVDKLPPKYLNDHQAARLIWGLHILHPQLFVGLGKIVLLLLISLLIVVVVQVLKSLC
jgi:hypothetical protein